VYTWFNDDGEITITADLADTVILIEQCGMQYAANKRAEYKLLERCSLSDQQLLDELNSIELGIDYDQLEKCIGQYIPLFKTRIRADYFKNTLLEEYYSFHKYNPYPDSHVISDFVFTNGKLNHKEVSIFPRYLMPQANYSKTMIIEAGMTYDEVREILGIDGYNTVQSTADSFWAGGEIATYYWALLGSKFSSCLEVDFFNGAIKYDSDIKTRFFND
jgi:hypothetical protein